jgi:hypothetical protein
VLCCCCQSEAHTCLTEKHGFQGQGRREGGERGRVKGRVEAGEVMSNGLRV